MAQSYLLVAIGTGLVLALLLGGRPRHLGAKHFRWWPLLPFGVLLQALVERSGVPAPFALLIVSYAYLLVFCLANLQHPGMGVILIGIALNLVVIAANHGMPVREKAARYASTSQGEVVINEVKHHLERPDSRLAPLGDIIPVKPLHQVLSFGDLVLCIGIADLLVHLMRPVAPKREATYIDLGGVPAVIDLTVSGQEADELEWIPTPG